MNHVDETITDFLTQDDQASAEGGASAGSSGGARQEGPPPLTPEPSVPAAPAVDDAGRDAASADADKEVSSGAAPRAVIILTTEDDPDDLHITVEFEPPYNREAPAPCHQAALGMLDLAARHMGTVTSLEVDGDKEL